jgi:hypothetical protein
MEEILELNEPNTYDSLIAVTTDGNLHDVLLHLSLGPLSQVR